MSRQLARKTAFSLVYEYTITQCQNEDSVIYLLKENDLDDTSAEFCKTLYFGIINEYETLSRIIERFSSEFILSRVFKVDLAILLIAVYEILFLPDIPIKVSCNEAVETAKEFSTIKSPSYINGVLASVIKYKDDIVAEFGIYSLPLETENRKRSES